MNTHIFSDQITHTHTHDLVHAGAHTFRSVVTVTTQSDEQMCATQAKTKRDSSDRPQQLNTRLPHAKRPSLYSLSHAPLTQRPAQRLYATHAFPGVQRLTHGPGRRALVPGPPCVRRVRSFAPCPALPASLPHSALCCALAPPLLRPSAHPVFHQTSTALARRQC